MLKERARILASTVFLVDLSLTAGAFFFAYWLRSALFPDLALFPGRLYPLSAYLPLLGVALVIWGALLLLTRQYRSHRTVPLLEEAWDVIRVCFTGAVVFTLTIYALRLDEVLLGDDKISRLWILLFAISSCLFLLTEKLALRLTSRYVRTRGFNYRTVLIVGASPSAVEMANSLDDHRWWGYRVLGFVATGADGELAGGLPRPMLGGVEDIPRIVEQNIVDDVIFAISRRDLDRMEDLFLQLQEQGIRARFALDLFPHTKATVVALEELDGVPLLTFSTTPNSLVKLLLKRALDVAVSALLLLLGMPVIFVIALAIKITSGGRVLFRQTRCGLNGRIFTLYKFRTMSEDAEVRRQDLLAPQRDDRPGVQAAHRSAGHRARPLPAQVLARRAAAALERAQGRHVAGRAAAADPRGGEALPALAAAAAGDEARAHLPVADLGPQRLGLRALDGARPRVHRLLVAEARPQDPDQDHPGRPVWKRRLLASESWCGGGSGRPAWSGWRCATPAPAGSPRGR